MSETEIPSAPPSPSTTSLKASKASAGFTSKCVKHPALLKSAKLLIREGENCPPVLQSDSLISSYLNYESSVCTISGSIGEASCLSVIPLALGAAVLFAAPSKASP